MKYKGITKALIMGLLLSSMSVIGVQAKDKDEGYKNTPVEKVTGEIPAIAKEKGVKASISNWRVDNQNLYLFYTGEGNISNEYNSSYTMESEFGEFTLNSELDKQGHQIKTTLTDNKGKMVYEQQSKLSNDRDFDIAIPVSIIARTSTNSFQVKITGDTLKGDVIISTADTIPTIYIFGIGFLTIGGAFLLNYKNKKRGV